MRFADIKQQKYPLAFIIAGIAITLIIIGVAGSLLTTIDAQLRSDAKQQVKALTEQAANNADDHIRLTGKSIEFFSPQLSVFEGEGQFILFDGQSGEVVASPDNVLARSPAEGEVIYDFLGTIQSTKTSNNSAESLEDKRSIEEQNKVNQLQQAVSSGTSDLVTMMIDGEANYVCVAPVGEGEFYIGSVIPERVVRTEAAAINSAFVIVFGIILLCLLAVLAMFSFFYRKRMNERGLEMQTHLYGALSDSLDMAVNMYSPENSLVTPIVAKSREIIGYSMAELMGNKRIADRIDLSESGVDLLKRLREGDVVSLERGEFSFRNRRTRELHWVAFSVTPLYYEKRRQLLVVFRDSTTAKNLELSMKDAMVAAEAANHAKSDFLSRMSHDIRTPMNAIIGMTQIARKHTDDPVKLESSLKKIDMASEHLLNLINDVLDISKIESGKVMLVCESFTLSELIESVNLVITTQCEQKNQSFVIERGEIFEENLRGDRVRLQQVLINLLSNSVKYTPMEGHISLKVLQKRSSVKHYGEITFIIQDDGIGMTPEFLEHLFEPFVMEGRSMAQGTGLGMPIVKNILTMMNGDIQVESEVDKGTKFVVTVSCECTSPAEEDEETQDILGKLVDEMLLEEGVALEDASSILKRTQEDTSSDIEKPSKDSENQKAEISDPVDFAKLRVLLAEDNELNAEIAKELLSDSGLTVEWAKDGGEVCALFEASEPDFYDAILMDIQMPVMDGYEATAHLRGLTRDDARRIPIIAMSANAFTEDIQASLRCGMNDHLSKPIDIRLVLDSLAEQIRKSQ